MRRRTPRFTRTYTLFPYTTLFRSGLHQSTAVFYGCRYGDLQAEIGTQIDIAHLLVGENDISRAFGKDMAFADDIGVVANIERLAHIVVGDKDRKSTRLNSSH